MDVERIRKDISMLSDIGKAEYFQNLVKTNEKQKEENKKPPMTKDTFNGMSLRQQAGWINRDPKNKEKAVRWGWSPQNRDELQTCLEYITEPPYSRCNAQYKIRDLQKHLKKHHY